MQPYLPDDVLLNCLARVSRLDYPTLSLVSKRFRSILVSTELYETRRLLGSTESCPYLCFRSPRSSKLHWFTLSRVPTRIPNSRWLTCCLSPCQRNCTKKNHPMISALSHDFTPPSLCWIPITVGYKIYVIGGYIKGLRSSRVFYMDCRSHTWHEAPSMRVARKFPLVSTVGGKIYVLEGCSSRDCHPSDFIECFDPKTQRWEHVPSPGEEIRGAYAITRHVKEGSLYLFGPDMRVVYRPKENKWDVVESGRWHHGDSPSSCLVDNIDYRYIHGFGSASRKLQWISEERSSWTDVKDLDLEQLPKLPNGSDDCVRLEKYGRNIAALWEEENFRAFGSTKKKTKTIWCAEIAIQRPNKEDVCGKVVWCDALLRVPKSCSFMEFAVATV